MESLRIQTCLKEVDVTPYRNLIKNPYFTSLREKSQLSFVDTVYPGGRQSRYEHSLFVYHFMSELCARLVEAGSITGEDKRHLEAAALLHDIGHPPFSHAIEDVLECFASDGPKNHHERAEQMILNELSGIIKNTNLDSERISGIISGKDNKSRLLSHNTLGTDKLAYILIDSYHTGYTCGIPYILDLFPWYYFSDNSIGIDKHKRNQIENMQDAIQQMYMNVYLHGRVKQYCRLMQKAVENSIKSGETMAEEIWKMPESALIYMLSNSSMPDVKKHMTRYNEDTLFNPVMRMRVRGNGRGFVHTPADEIYDIAGKLSTPLRISELERVFSDAFGINEMYAIACAPKRVIPEDLDLYEDGNKIGTLFERQEKHYAKLVQNADNFVSIEIYSDDMNFPDPDTSKKFIMEYCG